MKAHRLAGDGGLSPCLHPAHELQGREDERRRRPGSPLASCHDVLGSRLQDGKVLVQGGCLKAVHHAGSQVLLVLPVLHQT